MPKHTEWHLYRKWLWNWQEGLHWPPHANSRHIWAHSSRIGCSRTRWNGLIWSFPKLPQALTICLPQPCICILRLENPSAGHDLYLTFDHGPPCLHTLNPLIHSAGFVITGQHHKVHQLFWLFDGCLIQRTTSIQLGALYHSIMPGCSCFNLEKELAKKSITLKWCTAK